MNKNEICTEVFTVKIQAETFLERDRIDGNNPGTRHFFHPHYDPLQSRYISNYSPNERIALTLHHPDAKLLVAGSDEALVDAMERVRKALATQGECTRLTIWSGGQWEIIDSSDDVISDSDNTEEEDLIPALVKILQELADPQPKPKTLREVWQSLSGLSGLRDGYSEDKDNENLKIIDAWMEKHGDVEVE